MAVAVKEHEKLAIHGGNPAVPEGTIKKWPPIDDTDRNMVLAALEQDTHTHGPNCKAFEEEFAAWNGNRHAVTANSGTATLHMGVAACDCGAGDQVIVTAYSWSSSATCILQHNAIPVFVDIDFETMNMDVARIEEAITPKTKAIVAVHLHGLALDMDPVMGIAQKHGLKVIEDACQAHGATYKGKKVGTLGDCAGFSFNQNKCLCSGEGGMFVTDNDEIAQKAQMLWSFGETRTPMESRDYHAYAMGWKYRSNELSAAFGRAQLKKLDGYLVHQKANIECFEEALQGIPGLILPKVHEGFEHNCYNYVVRFDMEALGHAHDPSDFRGKLVDAMRAEGVQPTVWQRFILPKMTVFQAQNGYGGGCPWSCPLSEPVEYDPGRYPVAQRHADSHVCFGMALRAPNGPDEVRMIANGVEKVMANADRLA